MEGELWEQVYRWTEQADKHHAQAKRRLVHADVLIVRVYLWSALHERPVCWACQAANWPDALRPAPALPSQPTMSRRLRTREVLSLLRELERAVDGCLWLLGTWRWIGIVDGKPLPVGRFSTDPDADWGVGAGGRGWEVGYRAVALWRQTLLPLAEVRPMNVGEAVAARKLVARLGELGDDADAGPCYVLGDSQFDSNKLHAMCAARGRQLLAPPKKPQARGVGHRRHEPARLHALEMLRRPFGRALYRLRPLVEGRLGNLSSFGGGLAPLPSWVRRIHRVRLWLRAKLIINAARMRLKLERVN